VYDIANDVAHIGNDTRDTAASVSDVQVVEAVQYVL
jgi:hypothetical protein